MDSKRRRTYDLSIPDDVEELQRALLDPDIDEDCPDSDDDGDDEDAEDAPDEVREESSESEQSDISDDEEDASNMEPADETNDYYNAIRRNKKREIIDIWKWKKAPYSQRRTLLQNLLAADVGTVQGPARAVQSPSHILECFFDDSMIQMIVTFTNQFMDLVERPKRARGRDCRPTDAEEIKAFMGLLYLIGVMKMNNLNHSDFFDTEGFGVDFTFVMSKNRFILLLKCLRFDDRVTRKRRAKVDKLAAIRDIFEKFVTNCQQNYSPGENVTVDEKLEGFRGRCSFRQYIPKKPRKYGLKIYALVDATVFYAYNLEIYAGAQPEESPFAVSNKPVDVVKRMVRPIELSGRNVTMDNWFTDVELIEELAGKGLSVVGTLKKNKFQIPLAFKDVKHREVNSSVFGFRPKSTLVSYVPKPRKNVLLISSLHTDDAIDATTGDKQKPHVITYYNKTKVGVDTNDQMCETYTVKRRTKRWPMVIFFSMMNMAAINAHVIYMKNQKKAVRRRVFLKQLSKELMKPYLQRRSANNSGLHLSLQDKIKKTIKKIDDQLSNLHGNADNTHDIPNPKPSTSSRHSNNQAASDTENAPSPLTQEQDVMQLGNVTVSNSHQTNGNAVVTQKNSDPTLITSYVPSKTSGSLSQLQREDLRQLRQRTSAQEDIEPSASPSPGFKRKRCEPCKQSKKSRLTQYVCKVCNKYICLQHAKWCCEECLEKRL